MEAYPLRAQQTARSRTGVKGERGVGGPQKGALEGVIVLKYLDESGFYLCLPPTHTWTLKGQSYQHRVRSRSGSDGRINLIGTLCLEGDEASGLSTR